MIALLLGIVGARAHASPAPMPKAKALPTGTAKLAKPAPLADFHVRARLLGVSLKSPHVLTAAAAARTAPRGLTASERARLRSIIANYKRGVAQKASAQLRQLSLAYGKRVPTGPARLANHVTWEVLVAPDPALARVVLGALYLDEKNSKLTAQANYLRKQLALAKRSGTAPVTIKTFSKARSGLTKTQATGKTLGAAQINAELGRVNGLLAATVAARRRIDEVFVGAGSQSSSEGTNQAAADAMEEALANLAAQDDLATEQLLILIARLAAAGGDPVNELEQLLELRRAQAQAYLELCQQGSAGACDRYNELLVAIADLEAQLAD